jgi:hypothetical protein
LKQQGAQRDITHVMLSASEASRIFKVVTKTRFFGSASE